MDLNCHVQISWKDHLFQKEVYPDGLLVATNGTGGVVSLAWECKAGRQGGGGGGGCNEQIKHPSKGFHP